METNSLFMVYLLTIFMKNHLVRGMMRANELIMRSSNECCCPYHLYRKSGTAV